MKLLTALLFASIALGDHRYGNIFYLLADPLDLPPHTKVIISNVKIMGLKYDAPGPNCTYSVVTKIRRMGSIVNGIDGVQPMLDWSAELTGPDTINLTLENDTELHDTIPAGIYEALWVNEKCMEKTT